MKPIQEIGLIKTIRFIFYSFYMILFDNAMFPPVRVILLRLLGAKIGHNCVIHNVKFFNLYHKGISNFTMGDDCFLGNEVMIDLGGQVILENNVTVANRVLILSHMNVGYKTHPLQRYIPKKTKANYLKNGSFVGAGSIILPGVKIGKKGVVGAGSVVTKDVADLTVVVGSRAKRLKNLNEIKS